MFNILTLPPRLYLYQHTPTASAITTAPPASVPRTTATVGNVEEEGADAVGAVVVAAPIVGEAVNADVVGEAVVVGDSVVGSAAVEVRAVMGADVTATQHASWATRKHTNTHTYIHT